MQWRGVLVDKVLKLTKRADKEPPLIFGWKFVDEFVEAINHANSQAADGGAAVPPSPLVQESAACLRYSWNGWSTWRGMPTVHFFFSLVAISSLVMLSLHPWSHHIIGVGGSGNVLPVADVFTPKACTTTLESTIDPFPNGLWNTPW
ncbi:hypothetical protein V7S43_006265 [Phytophthora oleae]|uniref:Uncharacterized protein n=1 Tax=Phytophthora oleae TaxID=2107226 RepID=A0ABD3FSR5_9STRA